MSCVKMKFFIFICCTAHLLPGLSAKIWRTTPMSSVNRKRFNDDELRQVSKFAVMIDFVNNVYNENNDVSSFVRRRGPSKRHIYRRFGEPMSAMNRFANAKGVSNEDTKAKLNKMEDTVRYHVIENPEVLLGYKSKQKKDLRKHLDAVNVFSNTQSFSTAVNKLNDFPSQIEPGAVLHDNTVTTPNPGVISHNDPAINIRAHHDDEDRTTDEVAYRPSFPDDDDDDKPNTEDINLTTNKKENIKPKTNKKDHEVPTEITNTHEFGKKNQNSKALGKKDKAQIDKNKADTNISNMTGSIKNEYSTTKHIHSHEKLNKDIVRPKDKHDDKTNKKDGVTIKNSEKDKKQRSLDKNKRYLTPVERLISNIDNNLSNDRVEQHSIYAHKERTENSNKHHSKRHENREKYDTKKNDKDQDKREEKHSLWIKVDDKNVEKLHLQDKKWDKNHDGWSKKVKELDKKYSKIDKDNVYDDGSRSKKEKDGDQTNDKYSNKENDWDKKDDKLSKKEKELDKNYDRSKNDKVKVNNDDSWSKIEKKRVTNIDKYSDKETNWGTTDDRLKKEKHRNKMYKLRDYQDETIDKMEYEWNKRHEIYDKNENNDNVGNQWNQNDKDFNERDNEQNKKHDRTYIDDRNGPGNRYSDEHVDEYKDLRHDRYTIVDRNSRDSSTDVSSLQSR